MLILKSSKDQSFKSFFAKQYSLIDNGRTLPSLFPLVTDKLLSDAYFSIGQQNMNMVKIWLIFECLNCMINTFVNLLILSSNMTEGVFPSEWKKAKVLPFHSKNNIQYVKNYRPASLLPICGKVFERVIYNTMFPHFIEKNLISNNQSRFKTIDSSDSSFSWNILQLWWQLRS